MLLSILFQTVISLDGRLIEVRHSTAAGVSRDDLSNISCAWNHFSAMLLLEIHPRLRYIPGTLKLSFSNEFVTLYRIHVLTNGLL
jgi:hypothetical protein